MMTGAPLVTRLLTFAVVAVVYLATGKLGLKLADVHPSATAVWAPTGIALAALLRLGYGAWPAIFVAAFLTNVTTAGSIATSLGIATGNTLEAVVGCYLVTRGARGTAALSRPADVFRFTALGALVSTAVSATFGVTSLALGGYADWARYGHIWFTWWLGDAAGALVVAPLLLLWSSDPRIRWSRPQALEALLSLLSVVVIGEAVFNWSVGPFAFLCIPSLVWVAFRFGQREAATTTFVLSAIALWGTVHGFGPFPRLAPGLSLVALQAFISTLGVMALALAAAVSERTRAEAARQQEAAERARAYEALEKSEELHRAIAELTSDFAVILRVERDGGVMVESATNGFTRVTGYAAEELSEPGGWRRLVHEDTALVLEGATKLLLSGERVGLEICITPKTGEARWLRCHAQPFWDPAHTRVVRILSAAEDVTDRRETAEALRKQQDVIRELSTPVLRIRERLLILPVIGEIDALRAGQLTEQLLDSIRAHRAKVVVMDMTGAVAMSANVAQHILRTAEACRLLGASIILTGVSRGMADTLVSFGADLGGLATVGDLQRGIEEAERRLSNDVRPVGPPVASSSNTSRVRSMTESQ
jgi:PAS domain S-box-containing protein